MLKSRPAGPNAKIIDPTIPDEFVLPCDFIVGSLRFRKGVKLETVRKAAARWHSQASEGYVLTPEQKTALRTLACG